MRRGPVSAATIAAILVTMIVGAVAAMAQTVETYRDEFGAISYSGNDGSAAFSTSWIERGESDGPTSGVVSVVSDIRCADGTGNCLQIGSAGGSIEGISADRRADLDGADSATLSFTWRRKAAGSPSTAMRVRISSNGGSSWSTLATISLAGSKSPQSSSFDIVAHATSATVIRFEGDGSGSDAFLYIDDVTIDATFAATTTTTTVPPTTTTTLPSTTTTTLTGPPASTTTTTSVPGATSTTTTSQPPQTTTTNDDGTGIASTTTTLGTTDQDEGRPVITPTDTNQPPSSPGDGTATGDAPTQPAEPVESSGEPEATSVEAAAPTTAPAVSDFTGMTILVATQIVVLGGLVATLAVVGVGGRSRD